VTITIIKVRNNINIDIKNPSAITATGVLYVKLNKIQGRARPTDISNTFDPIDDETALSPRPIIKYMYIWINA
jgi:hypothetical protein